MGMYDMIHHKMVCPECGEDLIIDEQIKWTNDCILKCYQVGDEIDAEDGEYDFATWTRPVLTTRCNHCKTDFDYKIIVKDGVLSEIRII